MAKIEVKNNGCAEVAYADLSGNILILPGESKMDIPDESVKPLIEAMKRRAPQVFIHLVVDEAKPKKPAKSKKRTGQKSKLQPAKGKKNPVDPKKPEPADGGKKQ